MLKLNLQYFAEGVEIEYDGETSNLPIGKQARFACKDKSMPSDIVIKNKGVGEISGVTVTKDKVLEGETFYGSNGLEEGTMPNNGYIDGDYGATLDLNFTELLLNGAYRGSVTIYPQEVTIVPSDISQEISPAEGCVFGKIKVEKIPPADEWDGSGIVIAPIPQPMTFTINGTSYAMENRMTWYAWTRSAYNTDGFACANENDYVYEAESRNKVTDADGNDVLGTTYIVEGGAYCIKRASFTFTIESKTFTAEDGMTWYEWTRSDYAPDSCNCYSMEDLVIWSGNYCIVNSEGNAVIGRTLITEGGAYLIKEAVTTSSFTIYNSTTLVNTFEFVEGMTWGEFISSSYNPSSNYHPYKKFFVADPGNSNSQVYYNYTGSGLFVRTVIYGDYVHAGDEIINGHKYNVFSGGSAD